MLSLEADSVIDASATWFSPNPAGANGLTAIGEEEAQDTIAYGIPDVLGRRGHAMPESVWRFLAAAQNR